MHILVYYHINNFTSTVIPAKAGIQNYSLWIPLDISVHSKRSMGKSFTPPLEKGDGG
jgi:hypothetical protein